MSLIPYLAGFIDGEGCISVAVVSNHRYHERIQVKQVDPEIIDLLIDTFGGSKGIQKSGFENGRPLYVWSVSARKAHEALVLLLPYLRVKKKQAENCLSLRQWIGQPTTASKRAAMRQHHARSRELNSIGAR